jgi:large subunit ribosomal protein L4
VATLKKFNLSGQEIGQVNVSNHLVDAEANGQMIKDYIIALRANARQWSANTKTRSEVNHTTKKPHPQKGGGRARQGSLAAPQYKGGGRVFGPRPKFDQHVSINKKEKRAAIRFLISEKIKENRICVIENTEIESPKTKIVADFLKSTGTQGRVLFLGESKFTEVQTENVVKRVSISTDKHNNFIKSARNLQKVEFSLATNISGYDVLLAHTIILTEAALEELNEWLS